jgi:TonB-linked SusC/RagA family outer membrane protein
MRKPIQRRGDECFGLLIAKSNKMKKLPFPARSSNQNMLLKLLIIMKLSLMFVLLAVLQTRAGVFAQGSITLNMRQVEIQKVLNKIEKEGEFRFLYNYDLNSLKKKVDADFERSSIKDVLNKIFANTDLTYKMLENNLIVVMSSTQVMANIRITGKVTGSNGEALSGVSITVKGTAIGTNTDNNGVYTMTVPDDAILIVSYIGDETKEVKVNGQSVVDIQLSPSNRQLDQVVVVGYGAQKQKNITSAISVVSTKDISSRPIISPVEAITGKAPGVQVTVPSGMPGSDLSVKIRGIGSPNGSEPLYVVDGVLANDIRSIDPNTIETISILKDAAAAGIYGAAGSTNGIVMITTKQGTKGKPRVDLSLYTGFQQITKKISVLNNQQWLALEAEIFDTTQAGFLATIPSYYNLNTTNNNWQDLIYHDAMQTGVNAGISGGSEKGTYYLDFGYLNQDGIMVGSNFKRYSVKLSIDQAATSWLRLGANVSFNRTNQRTVPQNLSTQFGGAIISALVTPEYIPIYMPYNSPNPGVYGYSTFYSGDNPLSDIYNNTNNTNGNNFLGNAYAEISLPYNLKFRTQFNSVIENSKYDFFLDPFKSLYGISINGQGNTNYSETNRWAWDNTLTYSKVFGLHSINVVVGTSALQESIALSSSSGQGFATSSVQTLNAASGHYSASTQNFEWSSNSYFGRINYTYDDKYLFTGTFRADGTSRVGINDKWGTFPAVSAGWRVSKENFMQNVTWVTDLKIRAGWGETGNLPPYTVLYPSYTLLSPGAPYAYSSSVTADPGVTTTSQIGNPNLKWESGAQTNIGFDATFLDQRLTFSMDYYYKKVKNMIFSQMGSLVFGGPITQINVPGYDINKGLEFNIDAAVVKGKDFTWDINFNIAFNNNEITNMDTTVTTSFQTGAITVGGSRAPIYTQIIKNGYSLGTFWGYQAFGVDPTTGNENFGTELTNLGSALPKYIFGFTNTFHYKDFSLSVLIDGVQGNKVYNETRMEIENLTGYANESAAVLNRWQAQGNVTDVPRALANGTTNADNAALLQSQVSSLYVENGSFVRMRNATLSYQVSQKLLQPLHISALRFYVTGQNLFIITKYKGYYPELDSFGQGTNNQAVNAGQSPSLYSIGVDAGAYPAARTITIGANIQL